MYNFYPLLFSGNLTKIQYQSEPEVIDEMLKIV